MASKEFLDDDIFNYDDDDEIEETGEDVVDSDNEEVEEETISNEPEEVVKEEIIEDKKDVASKNPLSNPPKDNVIQSKPSIEIKEADKNPYRERYNPKKPRNNQKKKPLKSEVACKKLISISQKNIEVLNILREISKTYPSESEFICQAIIEKYKRETEIQETDIKVLVKDALEELVGEKFIIMRGTSDINVVNTNQISPGKTFSRPAIDQSSVNESITKQDIEENKSLLASVLDDMDDDDD